METSNSTKAPVPANEVFQNLNSVSFQLLAVIGFLQLVSSLLVANEISLNLNWLLSRLLDFPFFTASILYFGSLVRINLYPQKVNFTLLDTIFTIAILGLLIIVQGYDLITPNLLP